MKEATPNQIKEALGKAEKILIIQADNPDGDSLGSALALEQIIADLKKDPILYCGVTIPAHIRYLAGWDRVENELPSNFDLSIMVDNSSISLLDSLVKKGYDRLLAKKPGLIIDHHKDVKPSVSFASLVCNQPAVATAEVIYKLATKLNWPINKAAASCLSAAILSDSLGLSSVDVKSSTLRTLAALIDKGANLSEIELSRRKLMLKSPELLDYKGQLLRRVEYFLDNQIAVVTIPWEEIVKYSHLYNPPMLVMDDIRQVEDVKTVIAFKSYQNGKITVKIRTNPGTEIASKLAESFGGGGHSYASGFKITDGRSLADIKKATINRTVELLKNSK